MLITQIHKSIRIIITRSSFYQSLLLACIGCQLSITIAGHIYLHAGSGIGRQVHAFLYQEKQYMLQDAFSGEEENKIMDELLYNIEAIDNYYVCSTRDDQKKSQPHLSSRMGRRELQNLSGNFYDLDYNVATNQLEAFLKYSNFFKQYLSYPLIRSTIKNPPFNIGFAYHDSTFVDCTIELNYLNFSTLLEMVAPEYLEYPNIAGDSVIKNTFLHGIYCLVKPKLSIVSQFKCYPQIGLGGFWGKTDHIDGKYAFMDIPLSATVLLGVGVEYQFSKRMLLDCSWNYGIIYNINSFHLLKGSIAYRIY